MSDDFHIKYDTATRWEGKVHYIMAPPLERIDALMPMLEHLIQSQTDPSGDHLCPVCGKTFKIEFYWVDLTTDPLSISTFCETCKIHVFFQSNKIPSWARKWPEEVPEAMEFLNEISRKRGENNG